MAFTFVALGDDEVRINNYADNLELVPTGQSRIRFINGVVGVEQVNFVNAANGGTFAAGIFFGQGTDNFNVDSNTRTFNINETDVGTFYRIESFVLTPGVNYTYIVVGEGTDPENVDLIVLER